MDARTRMFLVPGAVTGAGAAAALFAVSGAWYAYTLRVTTFGVGGTSTFEFGPFGGWVHTDFMAAVTGTPMGVGPFTYSAGGVCNCPSVGGALQLAFLPALAASLLALACLWVAFRTKRSQKLAAALAALSGVALLVGPLLLVGALPAAFQTASTADGFSAVRGGPWQGFTGSDTATNTSGFFSTTTTASWGPGASWFLSLSGAILQIAGAVLLLRARPVPEKPRARVPVPLAPYIPGYVYVPGPPPGFGVPPYPYGPGAFPPPHPAPTQAPPAAPMGTPPGSPAGPSMPPAPPPPPAPPAFPCPRCAAPLAGGTRMCPSCGLILG